MPYGLHYDSVYRSPKFTDANAVYPDVAKAFHACANKVHPDITLTPLHEREAGCDVQIVCPGLPYSIFARINVRTLRGGSGKGKAKFQALIEHKKTMKFAFIDIFQQLSSREIRSIMKFHCQEKPHSIYTCFHIHKAVSSGSVPRLVCEVWDGVDHFTRFSHMLKSAFDKCGIAYRGYEPPI